MDDGDTSRRWPHRTETFGDQTVGQGWGRAGDVGELVIVRRVVAALLAAADRDEVWDPTVVVRLPGRDFAALAGQRQQVRQRLAALITSGLSADRRSVGSVRVIIEPPAVTTELARCPAPTVRSPPP